MKVHYARIFVIILSLLVLAVSASAQMIANPEGSETASQPISVSDEPSVAVENTEEGVSEKVEAESQVPPEKTPEPITGAFGIPLGEPFEPAMVANILGQEEHNYLGYEKAKMQGTRYHVEPKEPSEDFQQYTVATTQDGIIYEIRGDYQHEKGESQCEKGKSLAAALEDRYGEPRGKAAYGGWYSFRQISEDSVKVVRLYTHRCRTGKYSLLYVDDKVRRAKPAEEEKSEEAAEHESLEEESAEEHSSEEPSEL